MHRPRDFDFAVLMPRRPLLRTNLSDTGRKTMVNALIGRYIPVNHEFLE